MVLVLHHAHLDILKLVLIVKDVIHHVLNVQVHQLSVLIVLILISLELMQANVNKAQLAITDNLTTMENAQEFVILDFTIKMESVSLEDAQMDFKIMDLEDVSVHQSIQESVTHQALN